MTALTFDQICRSGGGEFALVMHIAGLDWAATNDSRLITALYLADTDPAAPSAAEQNAIQMRKEMFGIGVLDGHYSCSNEVQLLLNLDDRVGTQTTDYGQDKMISMSSWKASLFGGKHGYTWRWDSGITCKGVMGLDVCPTLSTSGVVSGIMSRDFVASSAAAGWIGTLYWWADTDSGLKAAIESAIAASDPYYLWVGNSCLRVVDTGVGTTGNEYSCFCNNQVWGTPNQIINRDNINGLENLRITNVPMDLTGANVKLFAIHWDADMQAQYEAML